MTTHRTTITVDVEESGSRNARYQQVIRDGLHRAMRTAVEHCGVRWTDCGRRDNGDGMVLILPTDVDNTRLAERLPQELVGRLREHNADHNHQGRIRLRVAVVDGEVGYDQDGPVGEPLRVAARLIESKKLRVALRASTGTLALIISDGFYRNVVKDAPAVNPDIYRKVRVSVKETKTTAWLCLPDNYAVPGRRPHPVQVKPPRPAAPSNPSRRHRVQVSALLLGLLLTALAFPTVFAMEPVYGNCDQPVQLNVNVSAEKAQVIRKLMPLFEASTRADAGGCKIANVQVTVAASTDAVITALGRAMSWQNDLREIGPKPHVLLPDSSWEIEAVIEQLKRNERTDITLERHGSIATSPLVLAEPGWDSAPERGNPEDSWEEVLKTAKRALPEAGNARVHRPSPLTSGTGLVATIALYSATLGRDLDQRTLTAPDAPRHLHDVELSITTEKRSDTALCEIRQQTSAPRANSVAAVVVSEKAAADFNQGEALGERCPREREATQSLDITYPRGGTVYLDHPFVEITWNKQPTNTARQRVIDKLYDFLIDGDAQAELRREHFRDRNGDIAPFPGAPPERPPKQSVGSVDVLALFDAYEDARRSARVLFLFDSSEAMEEPFRDTGGTRLRAATDAVAEMLRSVGERDEIGLWEFADRLGGTVDHQVLVPLGSWSGTVDDNDRLSLTRTHLHALNGVDGPGRVFDVLDAAVEALRPSRKNTADTRDAIVLVADASSPGPEHAQQLIDELRASPEPIPVFVIAFDARACTSPEWVDVVESTGGECHTAASVSDIEDGLNRVTTALWGEGID